MCDPWNFSEEITTTEVKSNTQTNATSSPCFLALKLIKFFQRYISKVDGDRCQMFPTCSQYGYEAFKTHGFIMGFIMTSDRLMRDNFEAYKYYPIYKNSEKIRYYDPISANDFWWR